MRLSALHAQRRRLTESRRSVWGCAGPNLAKSATLPPAMEHAMTVAAPDAGLKLTDEQAATLAALKQIRDQAGGALCAACGA